MGLDSVRTTQAGRRKLTFLPCPRLWLPLAALDPAPATANTGFPDGGGSCEAASGGHTGVDVQFVCGRAELRKPKRQKGRKASGASVPSWHESRESTVLREGIGTSACGVGRASTVQHRPWAQGYASADVRCQAAPTP